MSLKSKSISKVTSSLSILFVPYFICKFKQYHLCVVLGPFVFSVWKISRRTLVLVEQLVCSYTTDRELIAPAPLTDNIREIDLSHVIHSRKIRHFIASHNKRLFLYRMEGNTDSRMKLLLTIDTKVSAIPLETNLRFSRRNLRKWRTR